MQVRGAPAIAMVAAISIAVELNNGHDLPTPESIAKFVAERFSYLKTARPTAVNVSEAAERFTRRAQSLVASGQPALEIKKTLIGELVKMLADDRQMNYQISNHGADHVLAGVPAGEKVTVLTHCNTGAFCTGGFGTALGIIRALHERGRLEHAYCTETRPYNQGSRLTSFELMQEGIPSTLICDSMAACLMKTRKLSAVIVGADRIVSNGDTANKIGTYQLAIVAKHHNVPFYTAATITTIDFSLPNGSQIVIEERKREEMTMIAGKRIAPEGVNCWNPSFDVTPAELITGGIVTENGVFKPAEIKTLQ